MKIFTKTYCIIFIVLFALLVGGLVVGSIYDLQISKSIVNLDSTFGLICASFGESLGWGVSAIIGVIAFKAGLKMDKTVFKVLLIILGVLIMGVAFYLIFADMNSSHNGFKEISNIYVRLLLAALIDGIIIAIGFIVINTDDKKMLLWSLLILLIAFYVPLAITFITKSIASRPRYRLIYNGYENYTVNELFKNWYSFKNIAKDIYPVDIVKSDDFKSFPSGHSFVSMSTILLSYIPLLNKNVKDKSWVRYLILIITALYGLTIQLGRIIYGAHYLSDTTIGGLIAVIFSFFVPFIAFKILSKKGVIKEE